MEKTAELYAGKAKSVYGTEDPDLLVLEFRDDTSAFDGKKRQQLARKGRVNNRFNAFVMDRLAAAGVPTHFERLLGDRESLVKRLDMLPLECVVRNYAAGSLCRRYGVEEGLELVPPTFEFFLKSDALGDPMVNEYHIRSLGWAEPWQVEDMKQLSFRINEILAPLFAAADLLLVDYKLEFGLFHGELMLGDEVTPDGCRVWDRRTREKLDKDRFRQDLGEVVESYELVGNRLGIRFD